MKRTYESAEQATEVCKEALWLAWIAAGGPQGSGFLQNKPSASKQDVWNNACARGDYEAKPREFTGHVDADYVFGRMLKLYFDMPDAKSIEVPDHAPRGDYQSWCGKYPTYAALFDVAEQAIKQANPPNAHSDERGLE